MSKRFLLVMWEGGGTVPPELNVARRLIDRGHTVRVLGDPTIEPEARAAGCEFSPWTTAPHVTERTVQGAIVHDWEFKNPMSFIKHHLKAFITGPSSRWAADVDAELADFSPDVAMVDMYLPAAMIPAEARGVPIAGLMPNCYFIPTPGIPPMGPGFAPARGPLGRVRDAAIRKLMTRVFAGGSGPLNETRAAYGLEPVDSPFEQMLAGESFVLTTPAFDFTSPSLPSSVRYAGPQLDDPVWAEPWVSPWPADDPRPLVLVALTATFQDQAPLLNRIVEALARSPVRAVVTLGQMIDPSEVEGRDNVVVVPSAPHRQLLAEASLLVTHCGHGTLMKGLAAGVPVVCLPMGRDQNDAAARVVHRGAGIRLKPSASAEVIREAVRKVLDNPTYKRGAEVLSSAIADHEGCVDISDELERLANRVVSSQAL